MQIKAARDRQATRTAMSRTWSRSGAEERVFKGKSATQALSARAARAAGPDEPEGYAGLWSLEQLATITQVESEHEGVSMPCDGRGRQERVAAQRQLEALGRAREVEGSDAWTTSLVCVCIVIVTIYCHMYKFRQHSLQTCFLLPSRRHGDCRQQRPVLLVCFSHGNAFDVSSPSHKRGCQRRALMTQISAVIQPRISIVH